MVPTLLLVPVRVRLRDGARWRQRLLSRVSEERVLQVECVAGLGRRAGNRHLDVDVVALPATPLTSLYTHGRAGGLEGSRAGGRAVGRSGGRAVRVASGQRVVSEESANGQLAVSK